MPSRPDGAGSRPGPRIARDGRAHFQGSPTSRGPLGLGFVDFARSLGGLGFDNLPGKIDHFGLHSIQCGPCSTNFGGFGQIQACPSFVPSLGIDLVHFVVARDQHPALSTDVDRSRQYVCRSSADFGTMLDHRLTVSTWCRPSPSNLRQVSTDIDLDAANFGLVSAKFELRFGQTRSSFQTTWNRLISGWGSCLSTACQNQGPCSCSIGGVLQAGIVFCPS